MTPARWPRLAGANGECSTGIDVQMGTRRRTHRRYWCDQGRTSETEVALNRDVWRLAGPYETSGMQRLTTPDSDTEPAASRLSLLKYWV
jgi:hypothetical protein